ncbi:hypothetical protein V8C35DRAFT_294312 [Trichoderma chlorosporum]
MCRMSYSCLALFFVCLFVRGHCWGWFACRPQESQAAGIRSICPFDSMLGKAKQPVLVYFDSVLKKAKQPALRLFDLMHHILAAPRPTSCARQRWHGPCQD